MFFIDNAPIAWAREGCGRGSWKACPGPGVRDVGYCGSGEAVCSQGEGRGLKIAGLLLYSNLGPSQGARLAPLSHQPLASALRQGPLEKMSQQ